MVIVDTSVWADFLNGYSSKEAAALRELIENEEEIYLTGLIVQEVLQGIREKKKRTEIRKDLEEFVIINPSTQTHIDSAELFCACRKKGITIRKSIDCLIARIAIEYDLQLLHKDRDFTAIAKAHSLKIYNTK
jgi:predicted nucleic acid-binding protein